MDAGAHIIGHPCAGRSKVAIETFEAIASGQHPPFRPKTIKALLEAGLIERAGLKVVGHDSLGAIEVPVYEVPLSVHMQWCEWCDRNMNTPKRIQRKSTKGWKMELGTIYVGRPTRWGNPFEVPLLGRELAVDLFRSLMHGVFDPRPLDHLSDEQFREVHAAKETWRQRHGAGIAAGARSELRGHDLACCCPLDQPCHADVLLELANG